MDRTEMMQISRVLKDEPTWYLAKRYGKLWTLFASKIKIDRQSRRHRGYKKAAHLIANELKNSGELQAVEALKVIVEDMQKSYDRERIDRLIADFFARNNDAN